MSISRGKRSGSTGTSTESSTPTASVLEPLGTALDGSDPLSQFCHQNQDPLSVIADESVSYATKYFSLCSFKYNLNMLMQSVYLLMSVWGYEATIIFHCF